ncbi:MAG: 23S rRNA (adenine(2503)-C(2))-methyltransferase RlmN, partial [Nitrospirota bacterium]
MQHEKNALPSSPAPTNLLALTEEGLGQLIQQFGWPRYRTGQMLRWLYQRRARSIAQMTDLSQKDREQLAEVATISRTQDCTVLESTDGTR